MVGFSYRSVMKSGLVMVGMVLGLAACSDNGPADVKAPVRGLKAIQVRPPVNEELRHFPSVLQPTSLSTLTFEVSGKLQDVTLQVGQHVKKDEVLLAIDPAPLKLNVETAKAAREAAAAAAKNAKDDVARKEPLYKKGVISKASFDQATTALATSAAQLTQATRQVELAQDNLKKAVIRAPYNGVISSVDAAPFATITPASPMLSMYSVSDYEISFSVPFSVAQAIAVGKKVTIRLADLPDVVLKGHVKELGSRADKVSAFPVVVKLDEVRPNLRAGMAVEVSLTFPVAGGVDGFLLPLSVVTSDEAGNAAKRSHMKSYVYVYDKTSQTVKRREIVVGGIRENALIVTSGVREGEFVAAAGVSFLRDGLKVKLLPVDTKEAQ